LDVGQKEEINTVTDRFVFEGKPHGGGGFGIVVKGRDTELEREILPSSRRLSRSAN